jgi:hypothetical protein
MSKQTFPCTAVPTKQSIYPSEHYATWAREFPEHHGLFAPGGFGENLTTAGLIENTVAIGDIFSVGNALLQVTQPRQPCFKLAIRFNDRRLGRAMLRSGRTGWYARVVTAGCGRRRRYGDPSGPPQCSLDHPALRRSDRARQNEHRRVGRAHGAAWPPDDMA